MEEIQGNVVAGFSKDFQTLLFLRIEDVPSFKAWLAEFASLVATAEEVIAFNRLFKRTRDRRGYSGSVKASWINVAFSHAGLTKLTTDADAFFLVSDAMGSPVEREATQDHRPLGLVLEGKGLRVWVKTWGQLIEDARHR